MSTSDGQFNFLFNISRDITKHLLKSNYQGKSKRLGSYNCPQAIVQRCLQRAEIPSSRLNVGRFRSGGNEPADLYNQPGMSSLMSPSTTVWSRPMHVSRAYRNRLRASAPTLAHNPLISIFHSNGKGAKG